MLHTMDKEKQNETVKTAPNMAVFESDCVLPKAKLRSEPMPAEVAYRLIKDALSDEGNERMNLATFCQTYMEPEAAKIMSETLACNAIDKSEYPQMAQIENRCINIISGLWHGIPEKTIGCSTVGSSEACQLAGMAMKFSWQEKAEKAGLDIRAQKPNLVISSGYQVCWEKFCVYWDIEMRCVPMDPEHLSLDIDKVTDYIDEYTIGVVGILGITYSGKFDDIKALDKVMKEYNKTAAISVQIHVDAASGGLYCPFVQPELIWDFQLENVRSISTSGHKYGLVFPGVGWVVWRDKKFLPEDLVFNVCYLGGTEPTMAINFSRSGAQIIGQYYIFSRYGRKGIEMIHRATARIAKLVTDEIKEYHMFEFINEGDTIPVVCFKLQENKKWTLYELADRLRMHGWQVPVYPMPADIEDYIVMRMVFRADFSETMAEQLLDDMKMEIGYLEENVVLDAPGKNKTDAQGFTH